ncbi:isochorismatase family protein [Salinibacterium sp. G-O1]|uniref:isochorismatase family protein n=1 Tax=Salinibacterium sp. G-O1 TaxID=3046208 RepID=UPI0024BBA8C1|nr:isochorismatase family protein [Salinibacterium sp. G-O1]MDJ0334279.1 isochorismatase family protein [Salinibacterium sp. G-O1]
MTSALFIIDVQNDFTEGGALGVAGGGAVAAGIARLLLEHPGRYDHVFASRDWHDGDNDNGGHFSATPDFVDSWPVHCVAGTIGASYHEALEPALTAAPGVIHVRKGQGEPAYSIFEGSTEGGETVQDALERLNVTDIDVVGIATDYCVLASAVDALAAGYDVRVLTDLIAGVAPQSSDAALERLASGGAIVVESPLGLNGG